MTALDPRDRQDQLRRQGGLLREALQVLPDVLRLLRRLAADETMPAASGSESVS